MKRNQLERAVGFVTTHSRITIAVMLVLTVVAGAGATMMESPPEQDLAGNSTEQVKQEYIQDHYGTGDGNVTTAGVYVRAGDGGNVLSKASLLDTLRYEQAVTSDAAVAGRLTERRGVTSVASLVSARIAGDPTASYERRIATLREADRETVRATVRATLGPDSEALALMPASYTPGSASAESTRIAIRLRTGDAEAPPSVADAQRTLHEEATAATADGSIEYFTLEGPATNDFTQRAVMDNLELIGPVALVLIVLTLAFAYRDLADLVVGMVGVVLTLVWMFGLIGWLGVPFGSAGIIAPILLVGLSIDYGIHVFMRYREAREAGRASDIRAGSQSTREAGDTDPDIETAMRRGLASVTVALVLVTVTTALGFLANLTNSLGSIRQLALATALGVVAALVVFLTVVPALKVEVDALLERFGFSRAKQPIGVGGGRLTGFLTAGVSAARLSAVGVVLLAAVLGAGGAYAWTDLDRQMGSMPEEPADWKQELPDPVGVEEYPLLQRYHYVQDNFRGSGTDYAPAQILVEGDVAHPATLERIERATDEVAESDVVYRQGDGSVPVRSPLTVMEQVAATDPTFASVYRDADTDGDGVPDRNLRSVYDALFAAAPERAAAVVERADGEYRSLRVVVPMRQAADERDVASTVRDGAGILDGGPLSATATGDDVVLTVQGERLTRNMLTTLVVSLLAILALLAVVYRVAEGAASLGAVTVLPVALVVAWVLGGMWLLSVPLTLFTALMISLAIGLGVDYSIHVSERFAQELDRSDTVYGALRTAVVGTGGALLGSTTTTVGAFATLSLATFPALRQMGLMVGLALVLSFVASVFVLPSALVLWARLVGIDTATDTQSASVAHTQD